MKRGRPERLVQSGNGWALIGHCEKCGRDKNRCRCDASTTAPPSTGATIVRLRLEKRRGKPVTVLQPEGLETEAVRVLARELKVLCGTGGTVKEGNVEIQGDHRERVRTVLQDRGIQVRG